MKDVSAYVIPALSLAAFGAVALFVGSGDVHWSVGAFVGLATLLGCNKGK